MGGLTYICVNFRVSFSCTETPLYQFNLIVERFFKHCEEPDIYSKVPSAQTSRRRLRLDLGRGRHGDKAIHKLNLN